jgi:hypothetical protein
VFHPLGKLDAKLDGSLSGQPAKQLDHGKEAVPCDFRVVGGKTPADLRDQLGRSPFLELFPFPMILSIKFVFIETPCLTTQ